MALDRETLEAAHCWFSTDRVTNPEMTAFKQEARLRQARWRDERGHGLGSHANTNQAVKAGGAVSIPNGSKLETSAAEKGVNFLSPVIWTAAKARMDTPQRSETLNKTRLTADLLSSMPMCFNLFGELHASPERARATAELLFPETGAGPVEVTFEWSPGRGEEKFTNDRTAFDVAMKVGIPGSRQIIGIETKYHEHAVREPKPKPEQVQRHTSQRERYRAIAQGSGVFKRGWETLLDSELEQLWRDHLLVLSMLQHRSEWSAGRYVLVYPSRNVSFRDAARSYRELLVEDDTTFRAITVEELIEANVLHDPKTATKFRERYLW